MRFSWLLFGFSILLGLDYCYLFCLEVLVLVGGFLSLRLHELFCLVLIYCVRSRCFL